MKEVGLLTWGLFRPSPLHRTRLGSMACQARGLPGWNQQAHALAEWLKVIKSCLTSGIVYNVFRIFCFCVNVSESSIYGLRDLYIIIKLDQASQYLSNSSKVPGAKKRLNDAFFQYLQDLETRGQCPSIALFETKAAHQPSIGRSSNKICTLCRPYSSGVNPITKVPWLMVWTSVAGCVRCPLTSTLRLLDSANGHSTV